MRTRAGRTRTRTAPLSNPDSVSTEPFLLPASTRTRTRRGGSAAQPRTPPPHSAARTSMGLLRVFSVLICVCTRARRAGHATRTPTSTPTATREYGLAFPVISLPKDSDVEVADELRGPPGG